MAARRLQPVGRLRVDAATPFMLHVIVPLLEGFRERYPQVELELNSNEGITDLIEKRTDVAFRIGVLRDSTLHAADRPQPHPRGGQPRVPAHGTPTRVEQLREHELWLHPAQFVERMAAAGCRWRPFRDRAGDCFIQWRDTAADGGDRAGHRLPVRLLTRQDRRDGRLVQLFAKQTQEVRQPINAVYYRNTALAARITRFVDHVTQTLGQRPFDEAGEPADGRLPVRGCRPAAGTTSCVSPDAAHAWGRAGRWPAAGSLGLPASGRHYQLCFI